MGRNNLIKVLAIAAFALALQSCEDFEDKYNALAAVISGAGLPTDDPEALKQALSGYVDQAEFIRVSTELEQLKKEREERQKRIEGMFE